MESSNQWPHSTRSRPMKLIPVNSKSEQAFCAHSASFETLLNRSVTTKRLHTSSAADSADPAAWAITLDNMAHDEKDASGGNDQIHITPPVPDFPVIKIGIEELRAPIQTKVKSAVETAQGKKMISMFRILFGKTLCDLLTTEHSVVTYVIKNSSYSFVESVFIKIIQGGFKTETLGQSFNLGSRSETFIQLLNERIVDDPGLIAPVAAIVKPRLIDAGEKDLNREP